MQSLANSAGAGIQLSHHTLDLLAQASLIQIQAEDIGTGIQLLQAGEVLLTLAHFQTGNDLLQLREQGVGRGSKSIAVIVGCEGGFSPDEARAAEESGFKMANLGPRILRCETAPDYCLAAISYKFEL